MNHEENQLDHDDHEENNISMGIMEGNIMMNHDIIVREGESERLSSYGESSFRSKCIIYSCRSLNAVYPKRVTKNDDDEDPTLSVSIIARLTRLLEA